MAAIYLDSGRVPELNGEVRGGVTVVMHKPDEIVGLLAICELALRPPETPLLSVYKALVDPSLSLDEWRDYWWSSHTYESRDLNPNIDSQINVKSHIVMLKQALRTVSDLWQHQSDNEKGDVSCVAVIADPSARDYRR
jgi:hypothetical protein